MIEIKPGGLIDVIRLNLVLPDIEIIKGSVPGYTANNRVLPINMVGYGSGDDPQPTPVLTGVKSAGSGSIYGCKSQSNRIFEK